MDEKIIERVLAGGASEKEATEVAIWFASDSGQAYLSKKIYEDLCEAENSNVYIDKKLSARMKARFERAIYQNPSRARVKWLVAAAIIPFLILAGTLFFVANQTGTFSNAEWVEVRVPNGEQMYVVLQDGTNVHLNSGSSLKYPKVFGLFSREVALDGEGYFDVAEGNNRKFKLQCGDIKVTVTGTRFNAKAYKNDNNIVVSLDEGSVNVSDKENNVYSLKVFQIANYDKSTGLCTVSNMNDAKASTAWRTKSINFYRTPLCEIINTLSRQHKVEFVVSDSSVLEYKFSISTDIVDIHEIIMDFEKVSDIKFTKVNEGYFEIGSKKQIRN